MQWYVSAQVPFEKLNLRKIFGFSTLLVVGWLLYTAVVDLVFLTTVGMKPHAMGMAFIPPLLGLVMILSIGVGYYWQLLPAMILPETDEPAITLSEVFNAGLSFICFYGLLAAFMVSLAFLIQPFGYLIGFVLLFIHPLLLYPILNAQRDRTFLGLLDGCLEGYEALKSNYLEVWFETTLYVVIMGGIVYPVLLLVSVCSVIGLLCVPGILFAFILGYCHLLSEASTVTGLPSTEFINPFKGQNQVLNTPSSVPVPSSTQGRPPVPVEPCPQNPWRQ